MEKKTKSKISCCCLEAVDGAFLVLISRMGQPLMILVLGKKLSTSSLDILIPGQTFLLVWISKTQNQAVKISLYF